MRIIKRYLEQFACRCVYLIWSYLCKRIVIRWEIGDNFTEVLFSLSLATKHFGVLWQGLRLDLKQLLGCSKTNDHRLRPQNRGTQGAPQGHPSCIVEATEEQNIKPQFTHHNVQGSQTKTTSRFVDTTFMGMVTHTQPTLSTIHPFCCPTTKPIALLEPHMLSLHSRIIQL